MRVLVACEFSGIVRDAFRERGHDAVSVDLIPSERPGPHIIGDAIQAIRDVKPDLLIAHPPCTYITNAGVRHLHSIPSRNGVLPKVHGTERWAALDEACEFFRALLNAPVPRVAVENPVPHKYAVERIGRRPDQYVQPWMFGEPVQKAIGWWLRGLPLLLATGPMCEERHQLVHKMSPSPTRSHERSRFFPAVAAAMADQWGAALENAA
jgi:hypothetical protein